MQDIQSISTNTARVFGDRRLKPHNHHQALKCPRCESLNTKFCYYNNYNLSQPRHFCKNCRRYWTKGGVLRNVPVGGGCRKSKRSSKSSSHPLSSCKKSHHSRSSSDNSSSTNTATLSATVTDVSGGSGDGGGEFQISKSGKYGVNNMGMEPRPPLMVPTDNNSNSNNNNIGEHILYSNSTNNNEIGGCMSLMGNSTNSADLFNGTASFGEFWESGGGVHQENGILDPAVRIDDLLQNRGSNGGFATLDWDASQSSGTGGCGQGLFDFYSSTNVDHHQSYWSQTTTSNHHHHHSHNHHNQWSDINNDHSLFLP